MVFPLQRGLSTESEKKSQLCALCDSSEAGGEIIITI